MKKDVIKKAVLISVFILIMCPLIGCITQNKNHAKPSEQQFNDINMWVEVFEDPKRDEWQKPDEVVKELNLKAGDVIADIGAGTGYFTRRFAMAAGPDGKALGLDIELSMIKYMKEDAKKLGLKNYEARLVKTDDPELEPASVDVVFLCNTYHHIENRVDYFKKLSRSLKENGRIVVVDFLKKPLPIGPPSDHKMSMDTVIEELSMAGYSLVRSHKFLEYQYFLEFGL